MRSYIYSNKKNLKYKLDENFPSSSIKKFLKNGKI